MHAICVQIESAEKKMRTERYIFILVLAVLTAGCQSFDKRHQQSGAIAEIDGHFLYQATLDSLTMGLSGEDSIRVAQQYITQWAKDILMYERAKSRVNKDLDEQVEAYRRSLYVHAYENYLVERRMPKMVPDSDVQYVYTHMADRFVLNESIIKGAMVVVVRDAPHMDKLRNWLNEMAIDEIEKYAYSNANGYELFTDRWLTVSDVLPLMPIERNELESRLRQSNTVETKDSTYIYMLRITDKCLKGDRMPLDYAKPKIQQLILSGRRVEFLNKEREQMYDAAVVSKKIRFYEE